jgi:segregation and condensation protein B
MSLKAKLEAVIYAAEEPVTFNQLAVLFAADALEWKAEQEAVSAERAAEAEADLREPMLGQEFEEGVQSEFSREPSLAASQEPLASPASPAQEQLSGVEPSDPEQNDDNTNLALPTGDSSAEESELKRQARQRDREVRAILRGLLDEIIASCGSDDRGVEIREIAGGFRMATKPECHDAVRIFVKSLKPPMKLSLAALETLAVIAYKQPVTAPEVSEIRGVESAGVLGSLLARKLIVTAGRKQVIGRPILYKTTKEFLLRFGLKDISELPSMEEFEKMAAIELEEPEPDDANELTANGASQLNPNRILDRDSNQDGHNGPNDDQNDQPDAGAAPGSADPPAEQEIPVAELPARTPAVMAAQNYAEAPAETAAEDSVAPEEPAPADAPADDPDTGMSQARPIHAEVSATLQPENEAD